MLPEASSGMIETRHIVTPIRTFCNRAKFYEANIESVDLENKQVLITHAVGKETDPIAWRSHVLKYDYLVLALGGETNFFGMTQVAKYAFTMKSIDDATVLRNHVINMLLYSLYFNPPHMIPLVEVVGGNKTSPEAIQQAMSFYAAIGKKPIHLRKELPGHAANRLQAALYREVVYLIEQGMFSVEDADAAVSWGPGLRWGVMGPSLLWHLGGGEGGIRHFMEHLMDPLAAMMKNLGNPEITAELKQTITQGVLREAGNRSVEQLAQEESDVLLGLLRLRAGQKEGSIK